MATGPRGKSASKRKTSTKRSSIAGKRKGNAALPADVRVLVVDDDPEILALVVPFLVGKGYTVTEARDGDQALEKILTERPTIVVLDVMMPGLNGWEICRYVRERQELGSVRIIMATGIGEQANAATSPLYGADTYLDKPFEMQRLDEAVTELLRKIEIQQL